jgi:hypothetical protein
MKIDTYTKAILTIIAAALVGHLFKEAPVIPTALALDSAPAVTKVDLVSVNGTPLSNVISDNGDLNQTNAALIAIPVRVLNY